MNGLHFKYTDTEIKKILKTLVIIVDTREQQNQHILEYFRKKDIPFKLTTMKTGDYTAMIPANVELGIMRDMYFHAVIERKSGINELVESIKDRTRFENELIRGSKIPFVLIVEDLEGYTKILNGKYRSEYKPESLLGSLKTFEARYEFTTFFINPVTSGNYIYHHFLYYARELLKK